MCEWTVIRAACRIAIPVEMKGGTTGIHTMKGQTRGHLIASMLRLSLVQVGAIEVTATEVAAVAVGAVTVGLLHLLGVRVLYTQDLVEDHAHVADGVEINRRGTTTLPRAPVLRCQTGHIRTLEDMARKLQLRHHLQSL